MAQNLQIREQRERERMLGWVNLNLCKLMPEIVSLMDEWKDLYINIENIFEKAGFYKSYSIKRVP